MNLTAKAQARASALRRRDGLAPAFRAAAASLVRERVMTLVDWEDAEAIAIYVAVGSEVATQGLIEAALKAEKRVAVPRTDVAARALVMHEIASLDELKPGAFRVPEPDASLHPDVAADDLDVVIVPGISFDANGHRLGYGRGYFDRYLEGFEGIAIGLTYDALLVPALPIEEHDVEVDVVVTEARTLDLVEEDEDDDDDG